MKNLFLSNRLDVLLDKLLEEFENKTIDRMKSRTILVPNKHIGQWLLLEIAKKKGIAAGIKVLQPQQYFQCEMSPVEMFCSVYQELSRLEDPELEIFLEGKEARLIHLTQELSTLFFKYGQYDQEIVEKRTEGFQSELIGKVYQGRLAPVQEQVQIDEPLICFGVDSLPPIYWDFLFKGPELSIYLFSPCCFFWEDVSSDWERKRINRYWKKRGAEKEARDLLDDYLLEAPRNLANWGKLGRDTLRAIEPYDFISNEHYCPLKPNTLLRQIQYDLLHFEQTKTPLTDDSIQIFQAGSSRINEVECVKEEILNLGIPYEEISVMAPDIQIYAPLIEYVFSDTIPFRISGLDIATQSPFRQGVVRLLSLSRDRWNREDLLTFFENRAFSRKQGWDSEALEAIRSWVDHAHIHWGVDQEHREEVLKNEIGPKHFVDNGSWEKGLDTLLETLVYVKDLEVNAELFEELIGVLEELKALRVKEAKTLSEWADYLEALAKVFLSIDVNCEADQAAYSAFLDLLKSFRTIDTGSLFSSQAIEHLLIRPHFGQVNSSHLHAVRFSPIEYSAMIPAKVVFLIGMDEESFPRKVAFSSLDLLKNKKSIPDSRDVDRYAFLEAIFSCTEALRITYRHLTEDEAKPVGPSLVVEELIGITGKDVVRTYSPPELKPILKHFDWPKAPLENGPRGTVTISIKELRQFARHPWKYYLQKNHGIYIDEALEESFALEKSTVLRKQLQNEDAEIRTPGMLGKALEMDVTEKREQWQALLKEWEIEPVTLAFRENCDEPRWDEQVYVSPPIEFEMEGAVVRIVGEISQTSARGMISLNADSVGGTIKVWPDALATAIALNAPELFILKTGKRKCFQNPRKQLELFLLYYFKAIHAPSPLLQDWADSLLRKGPKDLEKVRGKTATFKDPILEWVSARADLPDSEEIFNLWGPTLKETFSELAALYPARGKS